MAVAQVQLDISLDDVSEASDENKMEKCYNIFYEATDTNNPHHRKIDLQDDMLGRISNETQSYDYQDNMKYQRIVSLIHILAEDFGFNPDNIQRQDQPNDSSETPGKLVKHGRDEDNTSYEPEQEMQLRPFKADRELNDTKDSATGKGDLLSR